VIEEPKRRARGQRKTTQIRAAVDGGPKVAAAEDSSGLENARSF